ncbi:MAG: GH92 family glycosyl hydrolase [Bacteroidota bacterium]|nr:GH92 family glycosyl hydrolase [Bacteroidota bacterium]
MKKTTIVLSFLIIASVSCFAQKTKKQKQEVDYVNSYIGTALSSEGGMFPCVNPPFAMTTFTPQTGENIISRVSYLYEDSTILGFIASHQPTVWMGDYGYVSVMPQVGELKVLPGQRKLPFKHSDEFVSPYLYRVKLNANEKDKSIKVEMTARERCGILRVTYPASRESRFIIQALNIADNQEPGWMPNLNSKETRLNKVVAYIRVDKEKNEITGYNPDRQSMNLGPELKNFKGYFVIQFDKAFTKFGTWNNDSIKPQDEELSGKKRLGAYVGFSTKANETVKVKIATSFISLEQARENLKREIPGWNFEEVARETRDEWQKNLEVIKLGGVSDDQRSIFYTSFYHCLLFPREFSEYGRYYSAADDAIHQGVSFTDYSLWDTFRAEHPFLIFTQPERVTQMITSMLQFYKEGGWLPMWPNPAETNIMIGTHADAVIGDAYVKGLRGYDVQLAYEAMRKNSFRATECDNASNKLFDREVWSCYEGQAGLQFYHSLGYIPSDYKAESVSRTVEYGIDNYCTAQVAKDLGKNDDYERLTGWSKNYKNLYNRATGFLAPRLYNGDWAAKADDGFTEGSPWTYLFGAMQDIPGTIELLGGNEKFATRLDQNFAGGYYRHDNEPGHHYIYLYDYCGQPWKTQELARKHTTINYRNRPDGINGNDDLGQMSAWYIFGVMGFYPVTPASGMYAIGAPQFPRLTMNYTANGKPCTLEIIANNISEKNKYVQKVTFDGKTIDRPFISHKEIVSGRKLVFEMGESPNMNWK